MKKFIITVDTEGDNLWNWKREDLIYTKNTLYLERFQLLCNEFNFYPVWLTNWEMLNDNRYVEFAKKYSELHLCEIGMHLHAWNNPPFFQLKYDSTSGQPFLIEYPLDIMERKIYEITELFKEKFGYNPKCHRAGRWVMNDDYFDLLEKYGYYVDCSYTPMVDWSETRGQTPECYGSNYSNVPNIPTWHKSILEVPVTIRKSHKLFIDGFGIRDIVRSVKQIVFGDVLWMRPTGKNLHKMMSLIDIVDKSEIDYIMFMIHSSELMPGGNPTFKNELQIDKMYSDVQSVFNKLSLLGYGGITLKDFYYEFKNDKKGSKLCNGKK